MIRSIDIHTGDYSSLDTDVVVLSETACVLRLHIGGFRRLEQAGRDPPSCGALDAAFGETEFKGIREAAE